MINLAKDRCFISCATSSRNTSARFGCKRPCPSDYSTNNCACLRISAMTSAISRSNILNRVIKNITTYRAGHNGYCAQYKRNYISRVVYIINRIPIGILVNIHPPEYAQRIRLYIPANARRIVPVPVLVQPRFRIKVLVRQPQVDLRRRGQVNSGLAESLVVRFPRCLACFICANTGVPGWSATM